MIDARRVRELLEDCLMKENEVGEANIPNIPFIVVESVLNKFALHPQRLESHREEICGMLEQIKDIKDGISFLVFGVLNDGPKDSYGWGEHSNFNELITLGLGLGVLVFPFPRDMWNILPGGVPYVQYLETPKEVNTTTPEEFRESQKSE